MTYFALGTTLANMVNVETWVDIPPHILDEGPAPLLGPVLIRLASGATRRDGFISHVWRFDLATRDDFNTLIYNITGAHFTTQSRQVYLSTIDETGHYSPFLAYVERPYPQEGYRLRNGGFIDALVVRFNRLRLQSVTKTTTYSITTSDRLVYGDTSGGSFTVTLPAASSATANTVYSVEKTAAANTLTIAADGSDTVNGGSSLSLTSINSRYDLVSDGVSAWTSITA